MFLSFGKDLRLRQSQQTVLPDIPVNVFGPFEVDGFVGLWQWNLEPVLSEDYPADSLRLQTVFTLDGKESNPVEIPIRVR